MSPALSHAPLGGGLQSRLRAVVLVAAMTSSLSACGRGGFEHFEPCEVGAPECQPAPDASTEPDASIPDELLDTDGDLVPDRLDSAPNDPSVCGDRDGDGCEDCSSGVLDLVNDGPNQDGDLLCDAAESCIAATRAVAATTDGQLLYSDDSGSTWQPSPTSPATQPIADVAYGLGRYVAVGAAGTVLLSDNGVDWSPATVTGGASINFKAVLHAENGWWAVVGSAGAVGLSFDNASTWLITPGTLGTSDLVDVAYDYDQRRWLVLDPGQGAVHTATLSEAPSWSSTVPGSTAALASVGADAPGWLAVDGGGIAHLSSDIGASWSQSTAIANNWTNVTVATAQRSFVVIASAPASSSSSVFKSTNGTIWDTLLELPAAQISSVAYDCGNGRQYMGANDGRVFAYPLGEAGATAAQASNVAIAGVATNADGAVLVRLVGGGANCALNGFPADTGEIKRIHRIDIQPGAAGQPILLGAATGANNRVYVQARLRIRTAGDYQFRLVLGVGDVAQLVIDGSEVITGGSCYTSRDGSIPGLSAGIHDLEIFYGDDGFADRITLQYAGPDTGGSFVTIPRHAFAP